MCREAQLEGLELREPGEGDGAGGREEEAGPSRAITRVSVFPGAGKAFEEFKPEGDMFRFVVQKRCLWWHHGDKIGRGRCGGAGKTKEEVFTIVKRQR